MFYPLILQEQKNDCAAACLAMLIKYYYRKTVILTTLKQTSSYNWESWSIKILTVIAAEYGVVLKAYHCPFEEFQKIAIKKPCLLYVNNDNGATHFIVIYKKRQQKFLVADPNKTHLQWLKLSQLQTIYLGTLIFSSKSKIVTKNKILIKQKSLWRLLEPYQFKLLLLLGSNFLLTLISLLASMFVKVFIDNQQLFEFQDFWFKILLGFIIIIVTKIVISFLQAKMILVVSNDFVNQLVTRYHQALDNSKLNIYEQYQDSDWWQLMLDLNLVSDLMINQLLTMIHNFVMSLSSLILLFIIHWGFVILILLQAISLFILNCLFYRLLAYQQIQEKNANLIYYQEYLQFTQSAVPRIGSDLNTTLIKKMQFSYEKLQKIQTNLFNCNNKIRHYEQIIISFSNFLILYFSSWLIINKNLSLGQMMFISSLAGYTTSFFQELGQLIINRKKISQSINRVKPFLFLAKEPDKTDCDLKLVTTITLKEVSFCHQNRLILKKINFQFQKTNFITGISGSGKSTLLYLIAGLYQDYQGTIEFNTINAQSLQTKGIICYVPQHPYLYEGTILDNIINFDYSSNNLKKIKQLQIITILEILKLTLTTKCYNNGQNLSSGQRQVIAFLKIFFHHPWKIILIDETLSNVDSTLKHQLVKLLRSNFANEVIIFVSHDLSLKKYFHFHQTLTIAGLISHATK